MLVERLNQTLKSMIHRFIHEDVRNWECWLDPLLFAVPQDSTGFSLVVSVFAALQVQGGPQGCRWLWPISSSTRGSARCGPGLSQVVGICSRALVSGSAAVKEWGSRLKGQCQGGWQSS